ncbi:MAG: hypothetical protein IPP68_02290 [Elusimicrobia bacterium]|nr:hypothetical protein [Elusimicrobiota bacterium]
MTDGDRLRSAVRLSWLLVGGLWGGWVGGGAYRTPDNADSFGTFFAYGFVFFAAGVGLLLGLGLGALIGGGAEKLLRRLGASVATALLLATLANGLALWGIAGFVPRAVPGIRADRETKESGDSRPRMGPPREDPCRQPPPENPRERKRWDEECR